MTEHVKVVGRSRPGSDRLLMRQAATLLAADLSLGEFFERLTQMLAEYIDSSVVFIALARPDGRHSIEYLYDHGDIRRYPHIELPQGSRAREVIRSGEIIWGNTPEVWAPSGSTAINLDRPWTNDSLSAMFVPMKAGGATLGCLSVQSMRAQAYEQYEVDSVAAIGHFMGVAVQNQRMYQELQRTAEFDRLTGLANHAKLSREIDAAIGMATSTMPAVIVSFNIVNSATFNEVYGYVAGEEVLQRVADALREFDDAVTIVGRPGGDSFMLVVRESTPEAIRPFVMRVASRLSELSYVSRDQSVPIRLACGYVIAPFDGGPRHELLALCAQRTRHSRMRGCEPIGPGDEESLTLYASFDGLETVLHAMLDRDPYTRMHALHVHGAAKEWSEHNLTLDRASLTMFLQATLLHDVGTLLLPDSIVVLPARLDEQQRAAMRQHAAFGRAILAGHPGYEVVADIVGQHHERWDGAGYPAGIAGEDIHPLARAIAILETFCSLTSDRPYHRSSSEDAALMEIQRCSGTQFDPALVERFVSWREAVAPRQLT
ncbi:MAG: HD domain-containing phosphohydrolase [Vulcanimicrobiaceae bacterium]